MLYSIICMSESEFPTARKGIMQRGEGGKASDLVLHRTINPHRLCESISPVDDAMANGLYLRLVALQLTEQ
jgi:hypothetical protein